MRDVPIRLVQLAPPGGVVLWSVVPAAAQRQLVERVRRPEGRRVGLAATARLGRLHLYR